MRLIKPSFEILACMPYSLRLIEKSGRTCYKSEDKITTESASKFVQKICEKGHLSVVEHASATVKFIIDRGVSHELVRHRLASYSQESTRYCDYQSDDITFIIPPWVNIEPGCYRYNDWNQDAYDSATVTWTFALLFAEEQYKRLREEGWTPEKARSVLPNSLKTEIVVTANFREWKHIFTLRTSKRAHPQMQEIMIPLCKWFQDRFPEIFEGILK